MCFFLFNFPQLPEPLILFRYYNDFIGLAKESQSIIVDEVEASRGSTTSDTPQISVELNRVLFKIKDLLRQLPPAHYKTLQFLIQHLHRSLTPTQSWNSIHMCVLIRISMLTTPRFFLIGCQKGLMRTK